LALAVDRPKLDIEVLQLEEREQNIRVNNNTENNISFIFVLLFNW
jgi:hypothetical protein